MKCCEGKNICFLFDTIPLYFVVIDVRMTFPGGFVLIIPLLLLYHYCYYTIIVIIPLLLLLYHYCYYYTTIVVIIPLLLLLYHYCCYYTTIIIIPLLLLYHYCYYYNTIHDLSIVNISSTVVIGTPMKRFLRVLQLFLFYIFILTFVFLLSCFVNNV